MVSLNNVTGSAAALNSLRNINKMLEQSQNRIATGLKVATASDNASVWASATKLRSESSANDALVSGISTAQGMAKGTTVVLDKIADVLGKMKETLALGYNSSADYDGIDAQITAYQSQLASLVAGANIGGENWLNAAVAKAVVVSVSETTTTPVSFAQATAFNVNVAYDAAAIDAMVTTSAATAGTNSDLVDAALAAVTGYATRVAGFADTLDTMKDVLTTVDSIRQQAISDLVDADMEEEAAKVNALQVKQQLAYQALSIGNSSSQNILRLFQ